MQLVQNERSVSPSFTYKFTVTLSGFTFQADAACLFLTFVFRLSFVQGNETWFIIHPYSIWWPGGVVVRASDS